MNLDEFQRMKDSEEILWWYRSLHRYLIRLVNTFNTPPHTTALDIGCGTGAWLAKLAEMTSEVSGVDVAQEAVRLCRMNGLASVIVGSGNELPYKDGYFGIVTCIDILECEAVSPEKMVSECVRVLDNKGIGVIVMAAHQRLLSEHDRAVHSVRRFNKRQLTELLQRFPVDLLYTGYLFTFLFPFMALRKMLNPPQLNIPRDQAVSDVRMPHPFINQLLDQICRIESYLLPRISLPLGTSVCAVFRKGQK